MITILALLALCTSQGAPLRPESPPVGASQAESAPATVPAGVPAGVPRPRDPFVFRCVLDGRCRMVTLALADDLWAAWDAERCAFYKAWKGGVKFDGPVYTTVHGPQPTSQGASYAVEPEGPAWTAEVDGKSVAVRARWLGYRLEQGGCVLRYAIALPDGCEVVVEERPEVTRSAPPPDPASPAPDAPGEARPGLVRRFQAIDLPAGIVLSAALPATEGAGVIVSVIAVSPDSAGAPLDPTAHAEPQPDAPQERGRLALTSRAPLAIVSHSFASLRPDPLPEALPAQREGGGK